MSNQNINIRWGWLKIMYWYTIIGAGGFGLGIIVLRGCDGNIIKTQ